MRHPIFIVTSGFLALLCMFFCRIAFFYFNNHELVNFPPIASILAGTRFDISVVCFWLTPLAMLQFYRWRKPAIKRINWNKIENIYLSLGFFVILFLCIGDIFFYKQFATHVNPAAFNWMESPKEVSGMLLGDPLYRNATIVWILTAAALIFLLLFISKKFRFPFEGKKGLYSNLLFIVCLFIGMRGGIQSRPLNIKDANVSDHYFFNQVAMNPVYHLYQNVFTKNPLMYEYHAGIEQEAYKLASPYLNSQTDSISESENRPNVVLILMESMASFKMKHTPFLNSLAKKSLYFDSFYSCGEHTYNGVYSSLFGEPALLQKHMLRYMESSDNGGLPGLFKSKGYFNIFHIPHSRYFDNMGTFLWKHHFDSLVDNVNIPKDLEGGSSWGTSDHKILEYSIRNMDFLVKKKKPIFNVVLTISDHQPYYIPEDSELPNFDANTKTAVIEYADWSLKTYFEMAAKKSWFKNTIFILVADHGHFSENADYPLPLSFHHIPCLIYSPSGITSSSVCHSLGAQQDLAPTLAGILGFNYKPNPLSVDLLHTSRNFTFFCSDNYAGYIDPSGYYLLGLDGDQMVYSMKNAIIPENESKKVFQKMLTINRYIAYRTDLHRRKN